MMNIKKSLKTKMSMILSFSLVLIFMFGISSYAYSPGSMYYIDSTYNIKAKYFTNFDTGIKQDSFNKNLNTFNLTDAFKQDSTEIYKQKLIDDVDKYLYEINPSIKKRKHLANQIVDLALLENIDICFILAQGTIETGFGRAGVGRYSSRKSIFGVCKRYNTYEECIDDYIKLLRKSYLGKHKTEHHLMNNYVTLSGYRYAESTNYEYKLKNAYKSIKKKTDIYCFQNELKQLINS